MLIYYIKYFLYTKIERDVFTEKILLKVVVLSLIVYIHILKTDSTAVESHSVSW